MESTHSRQSTHHERQIEEWSAQARSLWAKTDQDDRESDDWLCLPQHLVDSTFVAEGLWEEGLSPSIKRWLSQSLSVTEEQGLDLVRFLAGVHDVGKCHPGFQRQLIDAPGKSLFYERVHGTGLSSAGMPAPDERHPHSVVSTFWIREWLMSRKRLSPPIALSIASIAGAHHGLPAGNLQLKSFGDYAAHIPPAWQEVAFELIDNIAELTNVDSFLGEISARKLRPAEMQILTAIVIAADWIASNQNSFPVSANGLKSADQSVIDRFAAGFDSLKLSGPWKNFAIESSVASTISAAEVEALYRQRFDWPTHRKPHAFQRLAAEAALSFGSTGGIMCVEAPMGLGKTEAGLVAGEILASLSGSGGLSFAGPTLATTNSLFDRIELWAANTLEPDQVASIYLGHSKNALNSSFAALNQKQSPTEIWDDLAEVNSHGSVEVNAWMWGRKKGVLSNFFVGTIDQILFLALQHKHAMIRHLGLAQKVLVIDEVHAYSEYMSSYLEKALEWLGHYKVPVILLSATLPPGVRERLLGSYQRGFAGKYELPSNDSNAESDVEPNETDYPVISTFSASGRRKWLPESEPAPNKSVAVKIMPDEPHEVVSRLKDLTLAGGCALVVCNTVKRAQETYREALKIFDAAEVRLLHAGFTSLERATAEERLVNELGPGKSRANGRPHRLVFIATQVVEQSLDVDFDFLVTDIAPVDLILQRSGRMHRHNRPHEDRPLSSYPPTIYVRGFVQEPQVNQPPEITPMFGKVYPAAALWRASAVLLDSLSGAHLEIPADIPRLVRSAYDPHLVVPDSWAAELGSLDQELAQEIKNNRDRALSFQFPSPLAASSFSDMFKAPPADLSGTAAETKGSASVRDADPSIEVVVIQKLNEGYRLLPWLAPEWKHTELFKDETPTPQIADVLSRCSVRLPSGLVKPHLINKIIEELEVQEIAGWRHSPLLKGQLPLLLDDKFYVSVAGRRLQYTQEFGLELTTTAAEETENG